MIVTVSADGPALGHPLVPDAYRGFPEWSQSKRLAALQTLPDDPRLDVRMRAFLREALNDRSLPAVSRNNIANLLLIQDRFDPELPALLTRMISDPAESPTWREYAIQHLAASVDAGAPAEPVVAELDRLARDGATSFAGTALVQLQRLEHAGRTVLPADFDAILATRLADTDTDILTRMSAMALLGERGASSYLPLVRGFASEAPPALRRVAIATLGLIGGDEDRRLIAAGAGDPDPGVAAAGKAALARLGHGRNETSVIPDSPAVPRSP